MTEALKQHIAVVSQTVDAALRDRFLPPGTEMPTSVHEAMRYSCFAGGKRARPALVFAAYDLCGGTAGDERVLAAACAMEMFHVFSMIHDDLPCIDDSDLRRGRATNHREYGEAVALLAGDGLCLKAFELLAMAGDMELVRDVTNALGTDGVVGGEMVDTETEGKQISRDTLDFIHTRKTGALIAVSVRCGARLAGAPEETLDRLSRYGSDLGFAFQIVDDILDVEGTAEELGKDVGSDAARGKNTYPGVVGLEESKREARELVSSAKERLRSFGERAEILNAFADYVLTRRN
jgi:geranylgeranyl diphosphate synthase type II